MVSTLKYLTSAHPPKISSMTSKVKILLIFKVRLIINDLPGNVGMSSKEVEHSLQDQVVESRRKCTRGFQHWL